MTEFRDELEEYYESLEDRADNLVVMFGPREKNVLLVCGTIAMIEGNGLISIWWNHHNRFRIRRAFSAIGEKTLSRNLRNAEWLRNVTRRGVDEVGQFQFESDEEDRYRADEALIYEGFQDAADSALEYVRRHRLA